MASPAFDEMHQQYSPDFLTIDVFDELRNSGSPCSLTMLLWVRRPGRSTGSILTRFSSILREHQLYTKKSMCTFGVPETRYLEQLVGSGTRKPDPDQIAAHVR